MAQPSENGSTPKSRIFNNIEQDANGCWNWIKSTKNGYGQLTYNNKNTYAHRLSYELLKGEIPEGKLICHKCNNRLCVNPDHMYIGDKKTNAKDMVDSNSGSNQYGKFKSKTITLTNGSTIATIDNMSRFCRENSLSCGDINMVVRGIRNEHKGWRLSI